MEFTEDGIEAGLETVTAEAEDAGTRADVFLAAKLGVSRSNMQKLLEDGRVKRGEKIIKANYKVRAGEMFVVDIPEPEPIEAVSNKAVISGISSVLLITIPPTRNKTIYIKKIVAAFLIVPSGICLPKKWVCSFFLNTDNADETRTARVVVFIPPAVEPGEPPISIRIMISICPTSLSKVKFAVLNPAVLGVTD